MRGLGSRGKRGKGRGRLDGRDGAKRCDGFFLGVDEHEVAIEFRQKFDKDVFIDLGCFRKKGHNEADEPMITQPLMYKRIREHPGSRARYAERLAEDGVISSEDADLMIAT